VGTQRQDAKTGKDILYDLKAKIDGAVFPGLQGGPHFHTISAITVALGEALKPEFKEYQKNVLDNCRRMSDELIKRSQSISQYL
jgi:glycine hydroxymethyltransferase